MLRTFGLVIAILAAAPLGQKLHQLAEPAAPAAPKMIGQDQPVFLGRMTVVATALPEQAAGR